MRTRRPADRRLGGSKAQRLLEVLERRIHLTHLEQYAADVVMLTGHPADVADAGVEGQRDLFVLESRPQISLEEVAARQIQVAQRQARQVARELVERDRLAIAGHGPIKDTQTGKGVSQQGQGVGLKGGVPVLARQRKTLFADLHGLPKAAQPGEDAALRHEYSRTQTLAISRECRGSPCEPAERPL